MCDGGGHQAARRSAPRPAEGAAVDPITLESVDEVVLTMLMDNSYDGLTDDFEHGLPFHEARTDGRWEPDHLILDEQALVVDVRGQGLVVLIGCGHAGALNIARHALRLTGTDRLHAMLGGFHLTGAARADHRAHGRRRHRTRAERPRPGALHGLEGPEPVRCGAAHAFVPNAVGT